MNEKAHIAAQARSGLSVSRYCSENHLAPCLFYAWRRRTLPLLLVLNAPRTRHGLGFGFQVAVPEFLFHP
jgi:hypothetical protein